MPGRADRLLDDAGRRHPVTIRSASLVDRLMETGVRSASPSGSAVFWS